MNNEKMTYDILKELFNISVGKAADILSDVVNQKILLSVPDVRILNLQTEEPELETYLSSVKGGTLMVSSLSFQDNYKGRANLIFPAEKMKLFAGLCLQEERTPDDDLEFNDIDFDVIREMGNIILNCIMGETGNFLNIEFKYSLPEVKIFKRSDLKKGIQQSQNSYMLILSITFTIDQTEIEGAIIVDLTLDSMKDLLLKVNQLEEGYDES